LPSFCQKKKKKKKKKQQSIGSKLNLLTESRLQLAATILKHKNISAATSTQSLGNLQINSRSQMMHSTSQDAGGDDDDDADNDPDDEDQHGGDNGGGSRKGSMRSRQARKQGSSPAVLATFVPHPSLGETTHRISDFLRDTDPEMMSDTESNSSDPSTTSDANTEPDTENNNLEKEPNKIQPLQPNPKLLSLAQSGQNASLLSMDQVKELAGPARHHHLKSLDPSHKATSMTSFFVTQDFGIVDDMVDAFIEWRTPAAVASSSETGNGGGGVDVDVQSDTQKLAEPTFTKLRRRSKSTAEMLKAGSKNAETKTRLEASQVSPSQSGSIQDSSNITSPQGSSQPQVSSVAGSSSFTSQARSDTGKRSNSNSAVFLNVTTDNTQVKNNTNLSIKEIAKRNLGRFSKSAQLFLENTTLQFIDERDERASLVNRPTVSYRHNPLQPAPSLSENAEGTTTRNSSNADPGVGNRPVSRYGRRHSWQVNTRKEHECSTEVSDSVNESADFYGESGVLYEANRRASAPDASTDNVIHKVSSSKSVQFLLNQEDMEEDMQGSGEDVSSNQSLFKDNT
jgi:hypothetical protein